MNPLHRYKLASRLATTGLVVAGLLNGCGTGVTGEFANRLVGANGERVVAEDVRAIVSDVNLNEQEKRDALRDLGIEDEKLIDALLTL